MPRRARVVVRVHDKGVTRRLDARKNWVHVLTCTCVCDVRPGRAGGDARIARLSAARTASEERMY